MFSHPILIMLDYISWELSLMTIKDNIFSLLQLILNELVLSEFVFQNKKITSGQIMLKLCTVILAGQI